MSRPPVDNVDAAHVSCSTLVPMRSALPLAALSIAVAMLLSGCIPQDPEVVPPPEPSTEPVFASDEEALAAATDAYKAYLAMSDLIAQEGGANPERLAPFVTSEWLAKEVEAAQSIAEKGRHLEGGTAFDTVTLQQVEQLPDGLVVVVLYACIDLTNVRLLETDGSLVNSSPDITRWPFEISLEGGADQPLVVGGHEEWTSSEYC